MFDIILLAVVGVGGGVVTGLIPGVHPNAIAAFLITASPALLALFSPLAVIVFVVTMAISHTFLSFIPSVFLGMPDGETSLTVLPGHHYLLDGRGCEAVVLTVSGGVGVVILSVMMLPLLAVILPFFYTYVKTYIAFILLFVFLLMVFTEKGRKKVIGIVVFLMAGALGFLVFSPTISSQHILFPVFTGLFGLSTLIISRLSGIVVPPQTTNDVVLERRSSLLGIVKGFASGMIVGVLPGIGPSQAGVVVHQLGRRRGLREFLIALGGINTVAALFSLLSLYIIHKPRSGVALAVEQIIGTMGFREMVILVAATLFAAGAAAALTLKITKHFASFIQRINYNVLLMCIMFFLVGMTLFLTGLQGLLVLITATGIGLLPPLCGIKRTHCMGVLMLPLLIWSFGTIMVL